MEPCDNVGLGAADGVVELISTSKIPSRGIAPANELVHGVTELDRQLPSHQILDAVYAHIVCSGKGCARVAFQKRPEIRESQTIELQILKA